MRLNQLSAFIEEVNRRTICNELLHVMPLTFIVIALNNLLCFVSFVVRVQPHHGPFCMNNLSRIMKHLKAVVVESELGAGTRGASLGVSAMKVAAQNNKSPFFSRMEEVEAKTYNELLWEEPPYVCARYIDGIVKVYEEVAQITASVLAEGKFPLVLAGDHSSAGGTIAGIKKQFPDKRLGAIWVDACLLYTSPSPRD